MTEKVVV